MLNLGSLSSGPLGSNSTLDVQITLGVTTDQVSSGFDVGLLVGGVPPVDAPPPGGTAADMILPGETDMLMQAASGPNAGNSEFHDISNNQSAQR